MKGDLRMNKQKLLVSIVAGLALLTSCGSGNSEVSSVSSSTSVSTSTTSKETSASVSVSGLKQYEGIRYYSVLEDIKTSRYYINTFGDWEYDHSKSPTENSKQDVSEEFCKKYNGYSSSYLTIENSKVISYRLVCNYTSSTSYYLSITCDSTMYKDVYLFGDNNLAISSGTSYKRYFIDKNRFMKIDDTGMGSLTVSYAEQFKVFGDIKINSLEKEVKE